jgi:hypothetical protein
MRRRRAVLAWGVAAGALYALLARISAGGRIDSDGANSALQGWDLVHGHLLLHGWLFGDATFYTFEVPLNGVLELILGLGPAALHAASALTYLSVAAVAVALAVTDAASGAVRGARAGVVVATLAAPLLTMMTVWTMVEEPDHPGTSVFILVSVLLVDRLPGWRWTAPLVGVILCAGQLGDATIRYVAVSAIVIICGYRAIAARSPRSFDAAVVVAALASVPATEAARLAMTHLGGYQMVAPRTQIAPPGQWPGHVPVIWLVVRYLFGAVSRPDTTLGVAGAALGLACLLAAIAGLGKVAWTWRRASRAEQLLVAVIVVNLGAFLVSSMPQQDGFREIAAVLPCGAVLAARVLVPASIAAPARALAATGAAAIIAVVPLVAAAARPPVGPATGPAPGDGTSAPTAPLTQWLRAHGYTYGLGSYWSASVVTMQSGGQVAIRAVVAELPAGASRGWVVRGPYWEANALWYDPALHDATFVVAQLHGRYPAGVYLSFFGKPAATYQVQGWEVLDYRRNLLTQLLPHNPPGVGPK